MYILVASVQHVKRLRERNMEHDEEQVVFPFFVPFLHVYFWLAKPSTNILSFVESATTMKQIMLFSFSLELRFYIWQQCTMPIIAAQFQEQV